MTTLNLKHANPFEALASLMSALASETRRATNSGEFYELAIRDRGLNDEDVRGNAMDLFRECEKILQLPFLSEHKAAVESHQSYIKNQRDSFLRMAYSYESMEACNNFKSTWDAGRWTILSQSVKSFRNEYQNYQLIELVKRYLIVLRQLLTKNEETESVTDALEILTDILNSLDEELWKSSWEEFAGRFATLDGLLRTESEENPDSPLSNFYRATREAVWKVVYHTNRVADAVLFLPKAYAALNIGLALLGSNALPPESVEIVKEFMGLMAQLPMPDTELSVAHIERDALPQASIESEVE